MRSLRNVSNYTKGKELEVASRKSLGEQVRAARGDKLLRIVAEAVGIRISHLAMIEEDKTNPTAEILVTILKVTGGSVTIDGNTTVRRYL